MASWELNEKAAFFIIGSLITLTSLGFLAGCLDGDGPSAELDVVVVSILPQKEMVQTIAGEDIEVVVMVPEGQSPHSYSPTPGQLLKAAEADIYFKIGSGVEFEENHLDTLMDQNDRMQVIDLSEGIDIKGFDEHLAEDDHHDESTEDDHDHEGGVDPHIWLSLSNLRTMAATVRDGLLGMDPDGNYTEGYGSYIERLDDLKDEVEQLLEPYSGMEFLTYHPSWGYLADDLGLVQLSIEDAGRTPGPQGVAEIILQAKDLDIDVVFVEPQFDSSSAEEIADAIGGSVVTVDPLALDLIGSILNICRSLAEGFGEET